MRKIWEDSAWDDYLYWQGQDKKTLRKINALIKSIERGSEESIGKAELLKGDLSGYASVRIDAHNRLVYHIANSGEDRVLIIIQCKGHY
ncbi:MAG: Txe/YoeB family addiction module toxin [Coriobacteriales bacterium]|jgi:toxin YoeB|nr:Txe/YoeB family addiction module toxin [Coriobacteriales bacterium]